MSDDTSLDTLTRLLKKAKIEFSRLEWKERELGEVKATMMMNFGKPTENFSGGRLAPLVTEDMTATRMLITIVAYLQEKADG